MWNSQSARRLTFAPFLIAIFLLMHPFVAAAQMKPVQTTGSGAPRAWPRVHLPDPVARRSVSNALDVASEWLAEPDCAEALSAFSGQAGQSLGDRLAQFSLDLPAYLTLVVFVDGSRETLCVRGAFAFTSPGSRVVRLCVEELKRIWWQQPRDAVARVIHEVLHTLGQGEDPPTSAELTRMVLKACGPR